MSKKSLGEVSEEWGVQGREYKHENSGKKEREWQIKEP